MNVSSHGPLISFHWNEDFKLDPTKKYLIYYRGCFCPPTKGHFSLLKKWVDFPNVTLFIAQIGYSKRHGVSYKHNKKIWKYFIEKSDLTLEQQKRVKVHRLYGASDIEPYLDRHDIVLYIKGNEKDKLMTLVPLGNGHKSRTREKELRRLEKERRSYEKNFLKERVNMLNLLKPLQKPIVFLFDDRTEKNKVSATLLINQVKQWQQQGLKTLTNTEHRATFRSFLPDSLSDKTVDKIWKMLSSSKQLK
jgi:hypothetical protein